MGLLERHYSVMHRQALVALLAVGSVVGDFSYTQDVTGLIKDYYPFRVVCTLNSSINPDFMIRITGRAANNTSVFTSIFTNTFKNYQISLFAKNAKTESFPDYSIQISDQGVPKVPIVMTYGNGELTYHSAGEGLTVNTTTQAKDLSSVDLLATGKNLVDCTYVQCFRGRSAIEL